MNKELPMRDETSAPLPLQRLSGQATLAGCGPSAADPDAPC